MSGKREASTAEHSYSLAMSESEALKQLRWPIADSNLATDIFDLWNEFENDRGAEATFLRGIDRFMPMFHNYKTNGHSWVKHGITKEQSLDKNSHIEQSSVAIWNYTEAMLDDRSDRLVLRCSVRALLFHNKAQSKLRT